MSLLVKIEKSFNGLSLTSSPYGVSVLQYNAFGASEVEGVTTVPLLSKEEDHGGLVWTTQCFPNLFTGQWCSCLLVDSSGILMLLSSRIWSLCSNNIDLQVICRNQTNSFPEVPTVIWINLSHCPSGSWWCMQRLCKELKRTAGTNCIWASFYLGSH